MRFTGFAARENRQGIMRKLALIAIVMMLGSTMVAEEPPLPKRFAEKSGKSESHPAVVNFTRNRLLNSYSSACVIQDTPYDLVWQALFSELKESDAKGEIRITGVDYANGELMFDQLVGANKITGLSGVYTIRRANPFHTRLTIKLTINRLMVVKDVDAAIGFAEVMDIADKARDFVPKKRILPEPPAPGMLYKAVCPKGEIGPFRHGERVTGFFLNQRLIDVQNEGTASSKHSTTNRTLLHAGIDIAVEKMSKIYPCADGCVVEVIDNPNTNGWRALGFAVLVEHSNNSERVYSYYGNMAKKPFVQPGQTVWRGDTILGLAGSTGDESEKTHVHFEIRKFKTMTHPQWESWYGVIDSPESEKERARQLAAEWHNPQTFIFVPEKDEDAPSAPPSGEAAEKKANSGAIASAPIPERVPEKPVSPKDAFTISLHIDDDASQNASLMGNGDGVAQKGEVFDLIVVVVNENGLNVNEARVSVELPETKAFKAYGDLVFSITNLVPSASVTNRISMAVPVDAHMGDQAICLIELRDGQTNLLKTLEAEIPVAPKTRRSE